MGDLDVVYRSVKQALGEYAAYMRGPKLRQPARHHRVQECAAPSIAVISVGAALRAPPPRGLGLSRAQVNTLLNWATRSDAAHHGGAGPHIGKVAKLLRARGLITEPVRPVAVCRAEFVDLGTGETVRTTRAVWKQESRDG